MSRSLSDIAGRKVILIEVYAKDERIFHTTASAKSINLIKEIANGRLRDEYPREYETLQKDANADINIPTPTGQMNAFTYTVLNTMAQIRNENAKRTKQEGCTYDRNSPQFNIIMVIAGISYFYANYTNFKDRIKVKIINTKIYQCANCDQFYDGDDYKNDNKRMMKCAGCKTKKTFYCSKECQAAHWKAGHKNECESRKK